MKIVNCRYLITLLVGCLMLPISALASPHFEVEYLGRNFDGVNTTYTYEVCTNGQPPELSFFMVKIPCAPNAVLDLVGTVPAGGELGSGGQPVNHVHGVKWNCGGSITCPQENGQYNCSVFSMTFSGNLGEELSTVAFVKAGPGVDEHPTTSASCEPGEPEPLVCDACGPYTAYCYEPGVATVALDGSASSGGQGNLYYVWTSDCPEYDIDEPYSAATLMDFNPVENGVAVSCKAFLNVSDDGEGNENCEAVVNVDPYTCQVDCEGVPGGTATYDVCQVCNGPGLNECDSCDPNYVDLGCGCGEPAPNECNSCDPTFVKDSCGVCGGDNSTCCLDGEFDDCGVCDGPGSNVCGSCEGDLSCLECQDGPFACGQCEDVNITGSQFALDGNALEQNQVVRRLTRMLQRNGGPKRFIRRTNQKSQELYIQNWHLAWELPSVMTNCSVGGFCIEVSHVSGIDGYRENSSEFVDLARKTQRRLRRATGRNRAGNKLINRMNKLHEENLDLSNTIPASSSNCGDGLQLS